MSRDIWHHEVRAGVADDVYVRFTPATLQRFVETWNAADVRKLDEPNTSLKLSAVTHDSGFSELIFTATTVEES